MKETTDTAFIAKITGIILDHIKESDFGAEELVRRSGMTRYRLIKKLHHELGKGINQFIREVRLRKASELLKDDSLTIAEIAYKTGFGSPQYFNKCFHDLYGHSPGHIRGNAEEDVSKVSISWKGLKFIMSKYYPAAIVLTILTILAPTVILKINRLPDGSVKKNIAVMPFQNLSNDPEMDIWQSALQRNLVTSFASTGELNVIIEKSIMTHIENQSILKSQIPF